MESNSKIDVLHLIVMVLTLYVLGAMLADTFWILDKETSRLINVFDYVICAFFFVEFWYRLYQAPNKWEYLRWGWIDLVSSIPMVDFLRTGRIIRLVRLLRIIKAFRSIRQLLHYVFANKIQGTMTSVTIFAILLVIFASIGILEVETDPNSNIKTAEDAIWWTYTTITTVGYGDKYPVTTEGRILAMVLMTFGVGLFGTFTAYIASIFVADNKTGSSH